MYHRLLKSSASDMKCQPVKYPRSLEGLNQSPVFNSRGKNNITHALKEGSLYCDSNNKLEDENKHYDQNSSSLREETQNTRYCKTVSSEISPRSSPSLGPFYAGAKFNGAPSPTDLPKPPSHWTSAPFRMSSGGRFPFAHGTTNKHFDLVFGSQYKILINTSA